MKRESLRTFVRLAAVLGIAAIATDVQAQTPAPMDPRLMAQIQALLDEKAARTPAQRKLDSQLVLGMKKRRGDPMFARLPELSAPLEMRGDRLLVDVHGDVTPALEAALRALGGQVVSSHPRWSELRSWVPVARLEQLAGRSDVQWIRPAERPVLDATTQGDVAHRTSEVRSSFPQFDGRGVKVCVLSDGVFDLPNRQAAGELPAVEILGQPFTEDDHPERRTEGTAMLEIIHDIAPGATLGFATAFGGEAVYADNIMALHDSGCQVIVDDVSYPSEATYQDGLVAFIVDTVAPDSLYFASAGNAGRAGNGTVWEGDFKGVMAPVAGTTMLVNDFAGAPFNRISANAPFTPSEDFPPSFVLTWSEPFAAATSDYDLFLLNAARTSVVKASTSFQTAGGARFAFERIDGAGLNLPNDALMVALTSGSPRAIRIRSTENKLKLGVATNGHISGHAAAVGADAVAAAQVGSDPVNMPFPNGVESFSSDGPRRVFFTTFGDALTPGNFLIGTGGGMVRSKPDLTAADGVTTTTPGFAPFFGTSAAAPHAAGIAAVLKSAAPSLPNDKLRFVLKATARDIGAPGFDGLSGAGTIDAVSALVVATSGLPCFDGIDNDGDGGVDFPADPGCASQASVTESPACNDGTDNDLDGAVDLADPECRSAAGDTECGSGSAQSLAVLPLLAYFARKRRRSS